MDSPSTPPNRPHPARLFWGQALTLAHHARRFGWADLLVLVALGGLLAAGLDVARQWSAPFTRTAHIDLSLWALPRYTLFSFARGMAAYVLSLAFTLGYATWAAKDEAARRILIPLLDVLQSVPVLGFMPGVVLFMVALVPGHIAGLEMASIFLIFTGQAWNMTFSLYHSLRSVPHDLLEAAEVYGFSPWRRYRRVELPFATVGLVWNSMMSMAGGWFFLMITETFVLGSRDYRLPGLGSYMSVAVERGDARAMTAAVLAMGLLIVGLDQLLWRPVVVWARRFRVEETAGAEEGSSWLLDLLEHSALMRSVRHRIAHALRRRRAPRPSAPAPPHAVAGPELAGSPLASWIGVLLLVGLLVAGGARVAALLASLPPLAWLTMIGLASLTLARVLAAVVLGTIWTLPAGIAIGSSPGLSRRLQPLVQFAASFPAPMLFPAAIAAMQILHVPLGVGSVVLMLLGTQWYVLFNVIAGAQSIPGDLREVAAGFGLKGMQRFLALEGPAVFPYLVTGWVTAAGGAWNASIVSEFVTFQHRTLVAPGVGSAISVAAERGQLAQLAGGVIVLCVFVVVFNRLVWRRMYRLAEERFSLQR